MADENEVIIDQPSESEKRIKQLSEKVRMTSEERDEQARLLAEKGTENTELARERDFYQGFSDVVATNPAAKDHKDDILTKVKSGMSVEDATYAVLGKAGKLNQVEQVDTQHIAGGSAPITPPQGGGNKTLAEMSRDEKRQALIEAQERGDIALT